ncbi:MAG: hypothetical protein NTY04_01015 [Candidatus Staskawiczbacteria bacterium]|nr:hypothetical protein [Candidatus Staskawiczbacteria bacterium]
MDINAESFPLFLKDEVEEKLIKFYHRPLGLEISTQKAIFRIGRAKRMGVPIGIEELLAIGEQYSDLQMEYPMVALGTVCKCEFMGHDGFAFPCLYEIEGKRELGLTRFRGDPKFHIWAKDYRFPYYVPDPKPEQTVGFEIPVPQVA